MKDLGETRALRVGLDSSAALGIVRRVGLAKLKHVDTKYLWVQHARKEGRLGMFQVDGKLNGANLMTKYMGKEILERDMKNCGLIALSGRHADALKLEVDLGTISKSSVLLVLTLSCLPKFADAADADATELDAVGVDSATLVYYLMVMLVLVLGCYCCWAGVSFGR